MLDTFIFNGASTFWDADLDGRADLRAYFAQAWQHADAEAGLRFRPEPEFHFVYLVCHLAKHLQSILTNMIYADELKAVYVQKDIAYKDVTGAARETMRRIVDQLETVENPPESIRQKLMELALELHTVNGKKQYGYLKKPLKDMVDSIVDELENLPEVATYYSVWNGLRDTLEGYYKNRPRQHNPLSQQKEFRAIKNAIIQEAERLRQQMVQIFRENAAPPSNPMGIRVDSKRRKKLIQKRLAMGHKQDDHEQAQGYEQSL